MSNGASHRRRLRRVWWSLSMLLGVAFAIQTVRLSIAEAAVRAGDGHRAASVRPQNGWGLALFAGELFARGELHGAQRLSVRALNETPIATVAIRTLARVQDKQDGPGAGERAWQLASALGWRDKPTQLWALLRAAGNGEAEVFAMRADALLRGSRIDEAIVSLIRRIISDPVMRRAFAQRVAADPPWRAQFFHWDKQPPPQELSAVVLLMQDLGETASPPRRQDLYDVIARLIAGGRYAEAIALDRRFISRTRDQGSLIDDGGFELTGIDYRGGVTPFDWILVGNIASVEKSDRGRSISVTANGPPETVAAQRHASLAPGQYRVQYEIKGPSQAPAAIGFRLYCVSTNRQLAQSSRRPLNGPHWTKRNFDVLIPDNCSLVMIRIITFEDGPVSDAWLDNITISPVL